MLGQVEEARKAARVGIERAENARALSLGSGALFDDGQKARAVEWSRRAIELRPDDVGSLLNDACLFAKSGQRAEARGWGKRDWVEHDPDYDILRDDPRFKNLLAKLK